jgi:neutral ceramidase
MNPLTVGYGERVVTPPLGVDLCGYGFYLDRKAEQVRDDLKVRALVLKNQDQALFLASCDLIGLTLDFSDSVRKAVSRQHNIPAKNVLLACTHTHSGPATQSLPGLGEVNEKYMRNVRRAIEEAVGQAFGQMKDADFVYALEAVEPIGYNRRLKNFEDIDPLLKVVVFRQKSQKIYLLSYACHPVVLGPLKIVSADWPGALIGQIEKKGHQAIFCQGFSGDIDPVSQWNRWGAGTDEDLKCYGQWLSRRTFKAEKYAIQPGQNSLKAVETRLAIPLRVPSKKQIVQEAAEFAKTYAQFPGGTRFAEEWKEKALDALSAFQSKPYLENVPIQAMAFGPLKFLGIPGEVFCGLGLKLQKKWPHLFPLGYANGSIGYIPTQRAFRDPADYACACAPKFYSLFPFTQEIEKTLIRESHRLLGSLQS